MQSLVLIATLVAYVLISRGIVRYLRGGIREMLFTLINLAGYFIFLVDWNDARYLWALPVYVLIAVILYFLMRLFSDAQDGRFWLAFLAPIVVLVVLRYTPNSVFATSGHFRAMILREPDFRIAAFFIGISYLAFRCSHLVMEVRNGIAKKPGFWEYLGFCFFVPTMSLGPINTYSNYRRGFESDAPAFATGPAVLRVIVGFVKYLFLGNIFAQLSYSGLLLDDHYHSWFDLPIAALFYYLFLYCNFSGFCDLAIGGAALIGIPVLENFQDPFIARNMREFWNRWHITLSQYMRVVVFSPLSKALANLLGPKNVDHAVAITVVVVFLLIGIWHGTGWNYAVFGLLQAVGVVITHYYTIWLKKSLGREAFRAYNANPWIRRLAIATTFCYFTVTLFFFANSPADMKRIWSVLR